MSRTVTSGFNPTAFRAAREAAGVTRADLARVSDVSVGALHAWETSRSLPQVDTLSRAVAALGLAMRDVIDVQDGEELLSDLRVLKGMTQPELAAEAGLATSTLAGLEQGHLRLRNIHIQGLSRALDLPEDVVASAYARTRSRPL